MDFSVLMSVYYKEHPSYLKQSLNSIWNQTVRPTEIVLVKDGPLTPQLDKVIDDVIAKMPIRIVRLSKNMGLGIALNTGLEECSFDIVARMDSDDISKKDRFEKQLNYFSANPKADVVGSWVDEFYDNIDHVVGQRRVPENNCEIIKYAKQRSPMNHPTVMLKKSAVIAAGGYLHMPLYEDYYLWIRMLSNGSQFYNIQESLLFFRTSPDLYKRRGGFNYVKYDYNFQKLLVSQKLQSKFQALLNLVIRVPIRIIPNSLRGMLYRLLRR